MWLQNSTTRKLAFLDEDIILILHVVLQLATPQSMLVPLIINPNSIIMKITLLVVVCIIASAKCFYVFVDHATQCFFSTIYKQERLLIEIQTPIISLAHKILVTVKNDNNTLLEKGVVNQIKITVPRPSNLIINQVTSQGLQYTTCLQLVPDQTTNKSADQNSVPTIMRNGYLLSVKLMTNFEHKLQNLKQKQISNIDYKEIDSLSKALLKINTEQISLHQINEVKQKLSQIYLQNLKSRVIVYSMLEIMMVVSFTFLQIRIFKNYLNNVSIV